MISKTKIDKRIKNKKDDFVVNTIIELKKHDAWLDVAKTISGRRKSYSSINLNQINDNSTEGDTLVVLGKVLGFGNLDKKIRICAMNFSESALEKIKISKSEAVMIIDEVKKNPKAEGVKVIR